MNIYSIPPLLTFFCLMGLAILTIKQARWTSANKIFLAVCFIGAILYGDVLVAFFVKNPEKHLLIRRAGYIFAVYLFPVYLHFFYEYLEVKTHRWVIPTAYCYAFGLMWFTQSPLFIRTLKPHFFGDFPLGGPLYPLFGLISLAVMVYVVLLTLHTIKTTRSATRKNQLKYLLAGFGLLGILNVLSFPTILGLPMYPLGNLSFIPLMIFGIGLFKHDLMAWGIFFRKGLVYSILTSVLTCVYALIIIGADKLLRGYDFSKSIYFSITFFLFVAIVFGPVNSAIKRVVDRFFYRGKPDYQKTLRELSRMITAVLDVHEVVRQLTHAIKQSMQIETAFLFLSKASGSGYKNYWLSESDAGLYPIFFENNLAVIDALKRRQKPFFRSALAASNDPDDQHAAKDMARLKAELAVPLTFQHRLKGFLFLGEKKSGDIFTQEDMDLLETLAVQGALAIENAQAYGKIEELNRDLEKRVEQRTAELREALLEKERTQEQLVQSESLAAIGQLVAGTAHELNNPLAAVSSILQSSIEDLKAMDNRQALDEGFMDDLEFAHKELRRAADIVKSLLGLSRQTQTYSEAVDMNAVVRDALQILCNQTKQRRLRIVEQYDENLPDIHGNFSNLGQVVLNILQNAIQAVPETQGEILLQTRYEDITGQVVVECMDNGPGIPPHIRPDIFKPFFTTKPVGKGTGLGLYICHEILQKHQGSITLADNHGQGAKFVIRLPIKSLDSKAANLL